MRISDRLSSIQPSVTLSINSKALALRNEGITITSLAVGEPDFPTPKHICEAAKEAIDANFCKYTAVAGIPELREAACRYLELNYGVPLCKECILFGAGGKHCLYTFFQTMVNPGDEVLIPSPYWLSYPSMVALAGGKPVMVKADVTRNFKVTPDMLDRARTEKTKILIMNSPSNPTGAVYSEKEFDDIVEWALSNKIFVLSDEIYDQLNYAGKTAGALGWFARYPEHVAVANGLSKSFAMTGWRVGFMAAHADLIAKMAALQGHSTSNICSIAQKAALAALTGPLDFIDEMRAAYIRRRDMAHAIVSSWPNVVCPKPDGAFYLFADVHAYYNNTVRSSKDLCTYLLEEAHVALVPGQAFGDDDCIRFSYAVNDDVLKNALESVGRALKRLAS